MIQRAANMNESATQLELDLAALRDNPKSEVNQAC
jgi:hypothetical protein